MSFFGQYGVGVAVSGLIVDNSMVEDNFALATSVIPKLDDLGVRRIHKSYTCEDLHLVNIICGLGKIQENMKICKKLYYLA